MPVFVPVLVIAGSVAAAGSGVASIRKGRALTSEAKELGEAAEQRLEASVQQTDEAVETTDARLSEYGLQQEEAVRVAVQRMVAFLERHARQVKERSSLLFDGIVVRSEATESFVGQNVDMADAAEHVIGAGFGAAATYTGVTLAVAKLATASTGTAISTLSGAAAQNATLAYLGGGALSAGGGGMALGGIVLNAAVAGPVILIGGLAFAKHGQKALTKAHQYEAEVEILLAEHELTRSKLHLITGRVDELSGLLDELTVRAVAALDRLESEPFDPDEHAERFQVALVLTVAIRDVIGAPIVDEDGTPTADSERVLFEYRELL